MHWCVSSPLLCGRAVFQIQQLPHKSLSKLRPAVALDVVGVGHLVQDVGVVDGDADRQPEDLLPRLVWLVENEVPVEQDGPSMTVLSQVCV